MQPRLERLEDRLVPATLDLSGHALPVNVSLTGSDLTGYSGTLSGGATGNFSGVNNVVGNGGALAGEDVDSTFSLSAVNAGSYSDGVNALAFANVHSLTGGAGNDTFTVTSNSGSLSGTIDGGHGTNLLSYAGRSVGVRVNLTTGTASAIGGVRNVANLVGSSGGADLLIGNSTGGILDGGASGNKVLAGIAGNVVLTTHGSGHAILIGGGGGGGGIATFNPGTSGGDLVIGGTSTYQTNLTALGAILSEWARTDVSYATRVAHVSGTTGGLNGGYFFKAGTVTTTIGDVLEGDADSNTGQNWFIVSSGDSAYFTTHRKNVNETVTVL